MFAIAILIYLACGLLFQAIFYGTGPLTVMALIHIVFWSVIVSFYVLFWLLLASFICFVVYQLIDTWRVLPSNTTIRKFRSF